MPSRAEWRDGGLQESVVTPAPSEILAEVDRILASPDFDASQRNREFLRYVVDEVLAGRGDRIKAYAIAVAVFNRDDGFDPQADPIVRIEASRLRRSLERYHLLAGQGHRVRIDIPKGGYIPTFAYCGSEIVRTEEVAHSAPPPPTAGPPETPPSVAADPMVQSVRSPKERILAGGTAALGMAILLLAGALLLSVHLIPSTGDSGKFAPATPESVPSRPSILVLPFDNLAIEPDDDFLERGLAEAVLQNLLRFSEVRVFDHQGGGAASDAFALAHELGADYLVDGTVRVSGNAIRVTARLVSVSSGASIWGKTFDMGYDIDGLFAIEDEIAAQVATSVAQPYGVIYQDLMARLVRSSPDSVAAYRCILQTYDYRAQLSKEGHAETRSCLEQAVEIDPSYADAWAALALIHVDEERFDFNRPVDAGAPLDDALAAALQAVKLNPGSALAHHALSEVLFFRGEIEASFAESERSLELNPNNADAMAIYGLRLTMTGSQERGMALVNQALELNPSPPGWYFFASSLQHLSAGEYREALDEALQIDMPEFFLQPVLVSALYGHLEQGEEAQAALARIRMLNPRFIDCPKTLLESRNLEPALVDALLVGLAKGGLLLRDETAIPDCVS